jgi:hypothetical protein
MEAEEAVSKTHESIHTQGSDMTPGYPRFKEK